MFEFENLRKIEILFLSIILKIQTFQTLLIPMVEKNKSYHFKSLPENYKNDTETLILG